MEIKNEPMTGRPESVSSVRRLHFTEDEARCRIRACHLGTSWPEAQSTGKFQQDEEREKPSSRLRPEDRQAGEAYRR